VAQGEYDEPIDIRRDDEIGDLASAFEHMRDRVTDRERRILDLAYRDALTGLPNRVLFGDRLQQAIAVARRVQRPLSIIMMDLDRFKEVNESLGHQGGDQLLVEVSRRLQDVIRRRSDTIARMGGDEFAVLLPTEDTRDVMSVVRKMQQSLEVPIAIAGHMVDVGASIGIATYPDHGEDLITLLRHADSAMYIAKRNGTGCAIYDTRYANDSRERLSLMSELRQAVEHDELVAFYQPKIDLARPHQLSVEALIRWEHKTRGFVPPDQFIPFAEQTGYITMITEWMINRVLKQMRRWHEEGLEIHVAVNISTRDVMNPHFPVTLATLIDRHRCKAEWLTLEITETAIVDDPAQAQANIDRLHAQGCRISIDDFGTGYSSLAYLKRLKVDELKIDRSFVMGMAADPSDAVIVRSTIDLGHNMGLRVTAEGVETEGALKQLRAMGCDMAQGYLFSRAVGAADLEAWFAASPWVARRGAKIDELAETSY
jgi:diguanylate cyclase (GGDEF)-like protein